LIVETAHFDQVVRQNRDRLSVPVDDVLELFLGTQLAVGYVNEMG
jgi:hypothetical protein